MAGAIVRKLPRPSDYGLRCKLNVVVAVIAGPLFFSVAYLLGKAGQPTALEVLFIGLICASCVGVGMRVVHNMADRIRLLADAAEEYGEGTSGAPLPVAGSDEIGRLARVLNEVIGRVQRANSDLVRLVGEHMESLELQNSVLDNAAEYAILSDDPSGRILSANRGALDIFGLETEQEIVGRRLAELVENDQERLHEILAVTDGGQTWHGSINCRRADGTVFPARGRVAPRRDRRGNIAGRVILLRDVTREREAERRYSDLFYSLQEPVYVSTADGRFIDANEAMAHLLGYETTQGLLRADVRVHYRNGDARARWLDLVERRGFIRDHEVVIFDRTGGEHICLESTRALRRTDGGARTYLGTLIEITERRRLQQQVARSQRLDAVGTLASGLAHDFNNILSAIVPNAELIERHRDAPEPVRQRARTIRAAAERAGGITQQLLRFARQDRLTGSTSDLNEIVTESSRLLDPGFSGEVRFETVLAESIPPIAGDSTSLQQVVVNLVLNARDACGECGTVSLRTGEMVVEKAGDGLQPGTYGVLNVEDDGEGMSQGQLDRIFDPFFTTKPSGVGTGLGLSVVYAIVTSYGGHIRVRSEPGRGTSFDVFLPLAGEGRPLGRAVEGDETIIVVDASEEGRDATTAMLARFGVRAVSTADVEAAATLLAEEPKRWSCVLLEQGDDRSRCAAAVATLMADAPDLHVVVVGQPELCAAANGIEGVGGFLARPLSEFEIRAVLAEVIA